MNQKTSLIRFKNAKIYFRIFPMLKMQWEHVKVLEDMKTVYIRYLQDFGVGRESCIPSYWKFETDGVFYNNTQEEIYNTVVGDDLNGIFEGCNAVILNYGQTGCGKSLTATGLQNSFKDRGIAPRLISDLFERKEMLKKQQKTCIQMSYIETKTIYLNDLLSKTTSRNIQEFKNITIKKVKNEYSALKTLFIAEGRRQFVHEMGIDHAASGILTFYVISKPLGKTNSIKKVSKIHIIDLAGVDNFGNITSIHKNAFEIGNANLAKSQLEQFIMILCHNVPEEIHVKQRLNVLIHYLSDSLNAQSLLRCVGHIRIDKNSLLLTISMLRFGQIVRGLKSYRFQPNVSENEEIKVQVLEEEINEIKKLRDLDVMLTSKCLSSNIDQARLQHMQHIAKEYLQNETDEIVLLNVTDTTTVIKLFKNLYNKLEAEKFECTRIAYQQAFADAVAGVERVSSKTDSVISTKSSRKGSGKGIKPKETNGSLMDATFSKNLERTSKASTSSKTQSPRRTGDGKNKSGDRLSVSKNLKRSKTSSLNMKKRSTTSKRKSTGSTATAGTTAIDAIPEEMPLPTNIPMHEEAWNLFINDESNNYIYLLETLNLSEQNSRNIHKSYLDEVKHLHSIAEILNIRKQELQKAQMQRLFRKEEYDSSGNMITSDMEIICLENLESIHKELLNQQELVLKMQSELKIAINTYQNSKQNITDKFQQYCKDTFDIIVPTLDIATIEEVQASIDMCVVVDDIQKSTEQQCNELYSFEHLKEKMKEQKQKAVYQRIKCTKWIQSCKR